MRFNEAPASLPGKPPDACGCNGSTSGFNEAPASLPGKPPVRRANQPVLAEASMRPRQVCRGNARVLRPGAREARGFNEAPASLPGKHPRQLPDDVRHARASMRPRQVCRGNKGRPA